MVLVWVFAVLIFSGTATAWLVTKAQTIQDELNHAAALVPLLQESITQNKPGDAAATVSELRAHTSAARDAANDPLWSLAAILPGLGANFSAVSEVARTADDVSTLGVAPLVKIFNALDWENLVPSGSGANLEPLQSAAPSVSAAAHAVRASAERLERIDASRLMPQVSEPLEAAREQLRSVTGVLDASADASQLLPSMLGADEPRNYLLMIQNNAEARASGGIPGALAVLTVDSGKLSLGVQSSAADIGVMSPALPTDPEQQQIYSVRLGKFMQDVNLTPDFPTAASTAQAMWQKKTGQRLDGVLSIDPVALGFVLEATGPINIDAGGLGAVADYGLPVQLSRENVVKTLLSEVYTNIESPRVQDAYFASVAKELFASLSAGKGEATALMKGITRGADEGRILVWSNLTNEQSVLAKYSLSGAITGQSVSPAQFGIYFNDGTGAKMDYYVKRTVRLIKECARDGYEQTTVRVTSTNAAPLDAAATLPPYVTGEGAFGVPPGSVQTNIVAYGPVQANVETATLDGQRTDFAPYFHGNRPVGVLAVRLGPGESHTVEFTFGKIIQHTEPKVVVTPTVQDVQDVILPTEIAPCAA